MSNSLTVSPIGVIGPKGVVCVAHMWPLETKVTF